MPLTVTIPAMDLFNPKLGKFISTNETTIKLEHSLLSLSKWEQKWHKPYLGYEQKTEEESLDYFRCMCLTQNINPNIFYAMTPENVKQVIDYMQDPMTATTIKKQDQKKSREIITSEVIYFWMIDLGIPFDPCEKWHLNRLFTLIEVASIKSQPAKKMSMKDMLTQRNLLNAQRKARFNTHG